MQSSILRASRDGFLLATAGLVCLSLMLLFSADGPQAVASVAGVPIGPASLESMRIAVGLDLIIPLGYGAGFILLAVGLARDERSRMVASAMVLLTVVGMTLDLLENGTLLTDSQSIGGGVWVTVAKYGTLGAVGYMIPLLLTPSAPGTGFAHLIFRLITPIILATTIMRLSGDLGPWVLVPGLMFIFLFSAWLVNHESQITS